jgi:DNA mismatch endonuclease, patch repair protein
MNKFELNVARDLRTKLQLRKLGWRVLTIWECELRAPARLSRRLDAALAKVSLRQKEMHKAK